MLKCAELILVQAIWIRTYQKQHLMVEESSTHMATCRMPRKIWKFQPVPVPTEIDGSRWLSLASSIS
jgi:hypothetical protein